MGIGRREDGALVRQLRALYNIGTLGDLTDGQLLERFATDADEAAELAFAALVERHQGMVWRVCLAITRDEHAAEDAFQATFLVLVRRARSLWVRDSLGPWLHQVACRTASCLRASALRRDHHERRCAAMHAGRRVEAGAERDFDRDAAIHEEVDRLPEKYRAPVVLCDLQGRTHREAARCLGWPIGTVKSRQMQGRRLLRDRLVGRGFGAAVAAAVAGSLRQAAVAAMPREVARITAAAAMRQSARLLTGLAVSAQVITLTQGVIRAMLWNRVRHLAVVALAAGIAAGGAGVYVSGSQHPAPGDETPNAAARSPQPVSTEARARLRAQRLATRKARASYEIARLNRELAEIALEEYKEVTYPRDLAAAVAEIKIAKAEMTRADDRLGWATRMFDKGYAPKATEVTARLNFEKAKFALEQAEAKKAVLENYTREKTIRELESGVKKARVDELDKQAALDRESIRELELEHLLGRGATNRR